MNKPTITYMKTNAEKMEFARQTEFSGALKAEGKYDDFILRKGRFKIDSQLVKGSPRLVMELLSSVLVTHADIFDYDNTVKYYGYSLQFEPVAERGREPPFYGITLVYEAMGEDRVVNGRSYQKGDKVLIKLKFNKTGQDVYETI
jgi:hypothetical protein